VPFATYRMRLKPAHDVPLHTSTWGITELNSKECFVCVGGGGGVGCFERHTSNDTGIFSLCVG